MPIDKTGACLGFKECIYNQSYNANFSYLMQKHQALVGLKVLTILH